MFYLIEHKSLYMEYKNQEKKKKKKYRPNIWLYIVWKLVGLLKKLSLPWCFSKPHLQKRRPLSSPLQPSISQLCTETLLSPASHLNWNIEVDHGRIFTGPPELEGLVLMDRLLFCFLHCMCFWLCESREMNTGYCLLAKAVNDVLCTVMYESLLNPTCRTQKRLN